MRVVLVEDNLMFRQTLVLLLELRPTIEVCRVAAREEARVVPPPTSSSWTTGCPG